MNPGFYVLVIPKRDSSSCGLVQDSPFAFSTPPRLFLFPSVPIYSFIMRNTNAKFIAVLVLLDWLNFFPVGERKLA